METGGGMNNAYSDGAASEVGEKSTLLRRRE